MNCDSVVSVSVDVRGGGGGGGRTVVANAPRRVCGTKSGPKSEGISRILISRKRTRRLSEPEAVKISDHVPAPAPHPRRESEADASMKHSLGVGESEKSREKERKKKKKKKKEEDARKRDELDEESDSVDEFGRSKKLRERRRSRSDHAEENESGKKKKDDSRRSPSHSSSSESNSSSSSPSPPPKRKRKHTPEDVKEGKHAEGVRKDKDGKRKRSEALVEKEKPGRRNANAKHGREPRSIVFKESGAIVSGGVDRHKNFGVSGDSGRVKRKRKKKGDGDGDGSFRDWEEEEDDRPSLYLDRDEMDNLGGGNRMGGTITPRSRPEETPAIVLSDRTYYVRRNTVNDVSKIVPANGVYGFAIRKLWTSICPGGIDLSFDVLEERLRPSEWFTTSVINGPWIVEVRRLYESMTLVGYAVVTYGPREDLDGEICPHVVDPTDYRLEWRVDQHGVRHYVARPLPNRIPLSDPSELLFETADVFVDTDPTPEGDLCSRGRACLNEIVFLQQMLEDYKVLDHGRANVPLVVQSPSSWESHLPPWAPGGRGLGASPGFAGRQATPPGNLQKEISASMSAYSHAHSEHRQWMLADTQDAISRASSKARVTSMRTVDEDSGSVESFTPDVMWQRSVISLPNGTVLGNMVMPEPPKDFGMIVRQTQTLICTIVGAPSELVSGSMPGKATVAASVSSHESLRAVVESWRSTLERVLTKAYWRVYGEYHVKNLAAAAAESGVRMTPDGAVEAVRSLGIKFNIRAHKLDLASAFVAFDKGVIRGEVLERIAIDEYGLRPDEVMAPVSMTEVRMAQLNMALERGDESGVFSAAEAAANANAMAARSSRGGSAAPKKPFGGALGEGRNQSQRSSGLTRSKKKQDGDSGRSDALGGIGFSDTVEKPGTIKNISV